MTKAEKHLTEFPIKFLKRTVGLVVLLYNNTPDEGKNTRTLYLQAIKRRMLLVVCSTCSATAAAAL